MTLRKIVFGLCTLLLAAPGIATAQVALMQPSDSIVAISFLGDSCHGNGSAGAASASSSGPWTAES